MHHHFKEFILEISSGDGSLEGIRIVKVSEHPMQKVQKSYPRTAVVDGRESDSALRPLEVRRMASGHPSSVHDPRLGTLMLEEGLITESQLQEALRAQSETEVYKPIGHLLVEQKAISVKQLNLFIDKYHKRAR